MAPEQPSPGAARQRPVDVLLVGPDQGLTGGIANYERLLLKHIDPARVRLVHQTVGRRPGRAWGGRWLRPIELALDPIRLAWTLLRQRPALVHFDHSLHGRSLMQSVGLILMARLFKRPILIYLHAWDDRLAEAMVRRRWPGRAAAWLLGQAECCLVQAERFRRNLIAAGLPAQAVRVTTSMVELEPIRVEAGCDRPDESGQAFRVLWLSRMAPAKGARLVLEAACLLRREHPEARFEFVLAGDGPERTALDALVRRRELGGIVQLPGFVRGDEKARLYRSADLFVLPSRHREGFPTAVIEALAAGLPLVYTAVGGLVEGLTSENGLRIELDELSGDALAQRIWEMYGAPNRRRAMAAANRRLAESRFSVEVVCRNMEAIYLEMAA